MPTFLQIACMQKRNWGGDMPHVPHSLGCIQQCQGQKGWPTFLDPEGSLMRVTPVSELCATTMA